MILVTGAGGKTGRAVVRALAVGGEAVRALAHRSEQVRQLEALGVQEAILGDMRSPAAIAQAVRGVRAVYHIPPNLSPDEIAVGQEMINAARTAGVENFVYHSVLHPQVEAMPHHWLKMRVEEKLFESRLNFTILQPAAYMQNVLAYWRSITLEGRYPVPYAVETRLSMVDLEDVAEAAFLVLTQPGHVGATYELVGTVAMAQDEIAEVLSRRLGRPVTAEAVPLEIWEQNVKASGMSDYAIDTLIKMFHYYECYGFRGNARLLEWLLGRPPTDFDVFVERVTREK